MQLKHLSGRKTCERVKTRGRLWKGRHMQIRWLADPRKKEPGLFVGTLASAKLDKSAVRRNRMRRRCREAMRLALKQLCSNDRKVVSDQRSVISNHIVSSSKPIIAVHCPLPTTHSVMLLLIPRSSSLGCNFEELLKDASDFFSTLSR